MAITFSPEALDEMMAMAPAMPAAVESQPTSTRSIPNEYWSWDDPRLGGEVGEYSGPWDMVLKAAGFKGGEIDPITASMTNDRSGIYKARLVGETMNEYGGLDPRYELKFSPEAIRAIDGLRDAGYDLRIKHPDRRTFNQYWGLVTPEGVEDIKIAGSDLGEGLRAAVPYIALLAGPLGAQIGGALGGALGVTSTLGQQAIGSAIVNAGLTAAGGADFGDILRSGVTGLVTPYVPGVVGDIVPKSLGALESVAEKAITSAATSAISGKGDPAAAALGSLAGSAVGAIPGATSVPPAIMQGALELATTGSLSPSTLFNAAKGVEEYRTQQQIKDAYNDPSRRQDVVQPSQDIRAELEDILGTPSDTGTLVAGPMDFSAPNRAEQKTQVADYIRNQAASGVAGFKVGSGGVLEVEDRDRGITHRFTSDGSVLGSVDTVFGSRTGETSSTSAGVKDFLASPYVQGLFQGGEGSGDSGRYMVSEVADEGPATGSLTQEQSDELLKQAEQDLMEEELYQVNPPVTLPSTDVDTAADSGQSVFDQIDQDLGQLALDRQEETRAEQDQEQARKDAEAAEYEQFRLQQEFEQQGQPAATEIVQPPVAETVQEPVQEPVVIPPAPVVDQPVQVQEEPAVLPPTTVAQEQAQEAVQPPVQPSTGVGLEQVRQIVSEALLVNPSLTEQQVLDIVTGVVDNLPAGLTSQDVAEVVDAAIGRLPQGPTTEDIDSALTRAMADVATKSEVVDAIRNIQFPAGLSEADVSRVITDYMRQNPGLSPEDVATQVGDLLSRLPTYATPSDVDNLLRSRLSDYATSQDVAQLGGNLQTQVQNLNQDLQFAISDAIASGLRGDAALREGLDSLAGSLGTTRSEVLNQLGTTVQALRSDFASQLGGVQTQVTELGADLSSAIESARAAGLRGDAALQAAVDTLANRLGTTTDQVLSQLGATEQGLRDQFAGQLGEVESSLTGQIGVLSQQTQAALAQQSSQTQQQFNTLSAAQQAQADALVQQGVSFSAALNEVQSGLTGQIGGLRQDVQEQYDMLTAAQQAEVGRRVQQGEDLTRAISDVSSVLSGEIAGVQAGLSGQIGGLRQEVAEQYEMLTDAQQAEVARRVQQGEDLTRAISDVSSVLSGEIAGVQAGLAGQIGGLRQEVAEQYEMLSDAQQAEVARRVQQGEDLTRAISDVSSVLSGEIAGVQAGLTGQIGGLRQEMAEQYEMLTDAQQAEVARRVQQGENLEAAIGSVASSLGERLTGVESGLTRQIGGLRQEVADQYERLSGAQQAEVLRRIEQGEGLEASIQAVSSGLTQQIGGVEERLNSRIEDLVDQGVDFQTATNQALKEVTGSIETLAEQQQQESERTQTAIGSVEERLGDRINQLMQQGLDWRDATDQAIAEVSGSVSSLAEETRSSIGALGLDVESQIEEFRRAQEAADAAAAETARQQATEQRSATEAAVARAVQQAVQDAAARDAAAAASANERSRRDKLMGLAASFIPQATSGGVSDPYKATFLKPFVVGGKGPEKFEGPLSGFLKQATTGDFLPDKPQQPTKLGEEQQVDADQYFGGTPTAPNPLDLYQPEQEYTGLFGFRAGGMVPFMAQGGTRYGHNAHGALNVLEHSGKHRVDYRQGDAVTGIGDGQSDDIPAMLADGEFVIPADVVAALGNGSTKAGSDKLYEMMHNIRRHHRSAGPKDLPPPAKAPLEYIKSRKGRSA